MNETNKFYDSTGEAIQAVITMDGHIIMYTHGEPMLDISEAEKFFKQGLELVKEVKSNL